MSSVNWLDGRHGFLDLQDARIEYACYGQAPAAKPTIVLLHEGLGCVALWRDFPKLLAQKSGMGVFVYSRVGYGKSSPCSLPRPLDYMTREAIEVLPRVLNAIGIDRGILLGHSDGATIAAIYAGSKSDHRIRGMVLIAPHFFAEASGLAAIRKIRADYENSELRRKLGKYHVDPEIAFQGWNDAWLDPEFEHWNVSEVIDYFRIPVLAIQGRNDAYGTLAQLEEIEERIYSPFEACIIENCGHSPHLEKPEETMASIIEYTRKLERIEMEPSSIQINYCN